MTTVINGSDNSASTPALTGTDTDTGVFFPSANNMALSTGGTERMRVDSSGNVGIGVTPVSTSLGKSIQLGNQMTLTSFNGNSCYFDNNIYYDSGFKYTGNGYGISLRMTDGNLVFSNAPNNSSGAAASATMTERIRFLSSGGICFNGDTAAANALDDYEEGTFTPSFAFGGGTTGITYAEQLGTYIKIGQYVFCSLVISLSSKGSSTGVMTLTGLPFTIANLSSNRGYGVWCYTDSGTSITGSPNFLGSANTTTAEIFQSGTSTSLTNSNIQNGTAMRGFIIYRSST